MCIRASGRTLWLVACLLITAVNAHAERLDPQVEALIGKMSRSSHTLSYQGLFTYEHGSALESFKILQWIDDGVKYERLQYLSGPEREVIRQGQATDCHSPGDQLLLGRLHVSPDVASRLEQHYYLDIRGNERVAGRYATVLQIIPRDQYRYGYLLSIDQDTGLLLKSLLMDENRRILERFQFVDLQLEPDASSLNIEPSARLHRNANPHLSQCNVTEPTAPLGWVAGWLPPGFIFSGQQQVRGGMDMLMYTDGLSTFSIFLEPVNSQFSVEGRAQRGATNAYMGRVLRDNEEYRITVVGEIPILAAEQVAGGLRAQSATLREGNVPEPVGEP